MKNLTERIIAAHAQSTKSGFWSHDDDCPANKGCDKLIEGDYHADIGATEFAGMRCTNAQLHAGHGGEPLSQLSPSWLCVCPNMDIDMKVALIHSEISEALEEFRGGLKKHGGPFGVLLYDTAEMTEGETTALKPSRMDVRIYSYCGKCAVAQNIVPPQQLHTHKPVGFMSELADVCIRVFDLAGHFGFQDRIAHYGIGGRLDREGWSVGKQLRKMHEAAKDVDAAVAQAALLDRTASLARYVGGDLDEAIDVKMKFNATRSFRHGGKSC